MPEYVLLKVDPDHGQPASKRVWHHIYVQYWCTSEGLCIYYGYCRFVLTN